jgi:ribosomal protein L37AE/L43A
MAKGKVRKLTKFCPFCSCDHLPRKTGYVGVCPSCGERYSVTAYEPKMNKVQEMTGGLSTRT